LAMAEFPSPGQPDVLNHVADDLDLSEPLLDPPTENH
jgi:hypothetical protein